ARIISERIRRTHSVDDPFGALVLAARRERAIEFRGLTANGFAGSRCAAKRRANPRRSTRFVGAAILAVIRSSDAECVGPASFSVIRSALALRQMWVATRAERLCSRAGDREIDGAVHALSWNNGSTALQPDREDV